MFWKLDGLSDDQVLGGLRRTLGSNRRLTAELVAHLGEVEERRLHLDAACSSMFSYCVRRLGFSEDEACRRIEVARLARRFPAIFALLATGDLSLSVAALLKPHLSNDNADGLLAAVSGKSVQLAREAIAALFPRPDVPATMRKLPDPRRPTVEGACVLPLPKLYWPPGTPLARMPIANDADKPLAEGQGSRALAEQPSPGPPPPAGTIPSDRTCSQSHSRVIPRVTSIEPLAASRFKVQFTADADLKAKLDLARDLMRHVVPDGDLAVIIGQAVERLIADVMKQHFGARRRSSSPRKTGPLAQPRAEPSTHVPRAVRRAVVERDGLCCSWVDAQGTRCGARAFLEFDHRHPRGKGGASNPDNMRLLCRAHNRRAAELEYGREHVERAIAEERRRRSGPFDAPDCGMRGRTHAQE